MKRCLSGTESENKMKCLVFVLEIKDSDIIDDIINKNVLTKSFEQCIDDLSKHDNVCGDTNDSQNSFDGFRVVRKDVFAVAVAVTKNS